MRRWYGLSLFSFRDLMTCCVSGLWLSKCVLFEMSWNNSTRVGTNLKVCKPGLTPQPLSEPRDQWMFASMSQKSSFVPFLYVLLHAVFRSVLHILEPFNLIGYTFVKCCYNSIRQKRGSVIQALQKHIWFLIWCNFRSLKCFLPVADCYELGILYIFQLSRVLIT